MPENELLYTVKLDAEGKPKIVAATEELISLDSAAKKAVQGLGGVADITDAVAARTKRNNEVLKESIQHVNARSTAERNLEEILKEANIVLQEQTYHLELVRLEYENGEIPQKDYVQRLREILSELERQDAPSLTLIKRQRKINREITRLTPGLKNNATGMDTATRAVINLTQAARNAPFGLRSMSYSLQQSAQSAGRVIMQYGGVTAASKAMLASLTGPAGLVIGVTALTTGLQLASSGLLKFGRDTRDYEADSNKFIQQIRKMNDELNKLRGLDKGDLFDTEADLESLRRNYTLESDIEDKINDLNRLTKDYTFRARIKEAESAEELSKIYKRPKEHLEFLMEQSKQLIDITTGVGGGTVFSREQRELIKAYEGDLNSLRKEIGELNADLERKARMQGYASLKDFEKAIKNAIEAQKKENSALKANEALLQARLQLFEDLERAYEKGPDVIEAPQIDFGPDVLQQAMKEGQAFMAMEAELAQMRLNIRLSNADAFERLEIEKQARLDDIADRELISAEQRQRGIMLIEQDYAERRMQLQLEQQQQLNEQLEAIQQEGAERRATLEQQTITAINAINTGLLDGNKAVTATIIAVEKGLKIAQVITSGAKAAGEATILGNLYLAQVGINPLAAGFAANAFAQAGKIKITTGLTAAAIAAEGIGQIGGALSSGASTQRSGGDNLATTYRFTQPDTNQNGRTSEPANNSPLEIRILDGFGNIVARGMQENDAAGRKLYLREA